MSKSRGQVHAADNIPDLSALALSYASLASTARGRTDKHTFESRRLEVFAARITCPRISIEPPP